MLERARSSTGVASAVGSKVELALRSSGGHLPRRRLADHLLDDLDQIEWPEHVRPCSAIDRRSYGAQVTFHCEQLGSTMPCSPPAGHPVRRHLLRRGARAPGRVQARRRTEREHEVHEYVTRSRTESSERRESRRGRTGVALGRSVTTRNGEQIPHVRGRRRPDGIRARGRSWRPGHDEPTSLSPERSRPGRSAASSGRGPPT